MIYKSYLPYIYGFSEDGRYYVHVDDGSLSVLRKRRVRVAKKKQPLSVNPASTTHPSIWAVAPTVAPGLALSRKWKSLKSRTSGLA